MVLGVSTVVAAALTIAPPAVAFQADPVGPRGFAYVVGTLIAGLGVVLVVRLLLERRRSPVVLTAEQEAVRTGDDPRFAASSGQAFTIVGLTLLYAVLLDPLGYLLATALHVAACLWVMGTRSRVRLVVFPLAYTLATFVVFHVLLGVRMPAGVAEPLLDALGIR